MRRGEAFQINSEAVENGVRYTVIGTKTEASLRRVPFPADLLPYLPAKITGPLFRGTKEAATLKIGRWLRKRLASKIKPKCSTHSGTAHKIACGPLACPRICGGPS